MNNTKTVILIGGTGFVGRKIAANLVSKGYAVVVPTRSLRFANALRVLPLVKTVEMNVHDQDNLTNLMREQANCVAVINLVGVLHDSPGKPYGRSFAKNHVELVQKITNAMKASNIKRLIHMSALGADSNGPSMYQRSKGDGEAIVKSSGLDWTIFRPSVIFGRDDNFINLFAKLLKVFPLMPFAGYGARFQPVSVNNVAEVFVNSIEKPATVHQIYELGGPSIYKLHELVRFAGKKINKNRLIFPMPAGIAYLQTLIIEKMPGPTLMSRDNLASMKVDNILSGTNNVIDTYFGLQLEPLESMLNLKT